MKTQQEMNKSKHYKETNKAGFLFALTVIGFFALMFMVQNANATYCSLSTPQYCPPQQQPRPGNINNSINNNLKPQITSNQFLKNNVNAKAQATAKAQALGVGYGGQGGLGGAGGSGYGGEGGQGNGFGGQSSVDISGVGNSYTNVPRQTPMAYAPTVSLGSGRFKCNDSVSLGGSAAVAAGSIGFPVGDDTCELLVKSDYLAERGYIQESCEMLLKDDDMAEIFEKTGRKCLQPMAASRPAYVAPKFIDPDQNYKLDTVFGDRVKK